MANFRHVIRSNADNVSDWLDDLVASFDFTRAGKEASLGKDLVGAAAESMQLRCLAGLDPNGDPWNENEDKYAKYKRRRYDATQPGRLGGQMLDLESMKGQPIISADSIEMVYGTGAPPPSNARNGVPLHPSERRATDREKATYFTEGGREFYAFDERDAEAVVETASDAMGDYLKERGAT